ncbi:MAG: hypothetical protein QXT00_02525 [Ignisphaera sp.]
MERLESAHDLQTYAGRIPFTATVPFTLQKVQHSSDERGVYITLLASDSNIDKQGDIMDIAVLENFARDAKEGKVKLRRSHSDSFYIATSTDGQLVRAPDGSVQLYITFKAEDIGGTYYPEILHLLKLFKSQGNVPMQASVGGWITDYETAIINGRLVRIIKKAELEHVALTPLAGAVNPRTRVIEVLVKSFIEAIERFEKEAQHNVGMIVAHERNDEVEQRRDESMEERAITAKSIMRDLEKCSLERRRLGYTKSDIERLYERANRFGIAPSPLGNIIKPEIYLDYDEFADPVNYFFPLTKEYIIAGIEFARTQPQTFLSIYDMNSARQVYTRLIKSALDMGIEVEFAGTPIDALLPEDVASQLPNYNPEVYNMLKSWASAMQDYYTMLVSGLYDDVIDASEEEYAKLVNELEQRASRFGYEPAPTAKLKPHKAFEGIPLHKFADPVGYLFPTTPEWVIHSYRAFRYTPVRKLYAENAQRFIYGRILKGLESVGALIPYDATFELNKYFASSPVFIGTESYAPAHTAVPVSAQLAKAASSAQQFAYTQSALVVASQMQKAMHTEIEETQRAQEELVKSESAPSDATTVAEAPKFPFVIGAKFGIPKKSQIGVFTIHPALVKLYPDVTKKSGEIPGLGIIAGTQLARKLGLENISDIVQPKEIKVRWVGPDKIKTPIAVIDGAKQGGKEVKDKVTEVGFKVIGALQALHKGDVLAEWVVLSNGTVIETNFIGWNTPVILRKGFLPVVDIARHIENEIVKRGWAPDDGSLYISSIGTNFVIWSVGRDTYITPMRITDDGRVELYDVKIPAVVTAVPAPGFSDEADNHIVQAFIAAVAQELGEDHEWVREARERYSALDFDEFDEEPEEWVSTKPARREETEEVEEPGEAEEVEREDVEGEAALEEDIEAEITEGLESAPNVSVGEEEGALGEASEEFGDEEDVEVTLLPSEESEDWESDENAPEVPFEGVEGEEGDERLVDIVGAEEEEEGETREGGRAIRWVDEE